MSDSNHKELENGRPGRIGRVTPVDQSSPTEKSHNVAVENKAGGNQLTQINQLSTPVILWSLGLVLLAIAIVALGLIYVSSVAASAVGIANQAERQAQNAEREARLAMDKEEIDASDIKAAKTLIDSYVIAKQVVQQEKAK